jgi:hypothetical protein
MCLGWEFGMQRLFIASLLFVLAGCATKYQDMGFTGGVGAQQVTSDTFRIQAQGNGYTSAASVQDYVLLKAAETTKQSGGTHFILISAANTTRVDQLQTSGTAQTTFVGHNASTTYTPGSTETIIKPGQDAYIRVLNVKAGQTLPAGAISADEIIKYVGPRVQR